MIVFHDEYTKVVFAKTLTHFRKIDGDKLVIKDNRTFANFALRFMSMESTEVHLMICPRNVSEKGIAKEIAFRWEIMDEGELENELTRIQRGDDNHNAWDLRLAHYRTAGVMAGALINHGTEDEPNWGSHT